MHPVVQGVIASRNGQDSAGNTFRSGALSTLDLAFGTDTNAFFSEDTALVDLALGADVNAFFSGDAARIELELGSDVNAFFSGDTAFVDLRLGPNPNTFFFSESDEARIDINLGPPPTNVFYSENIDNRVVILLAPGSSIPIFSELDTHQVSFLFGSTENAFFGDDLNSSTAIIPLTLTPRGETGLFFSVNDSVVIPLTLAPRGESSLFFSTNDIAAIPLMLAPRGETGLFFSVDSTASIPLRLAAPSESTSFFTLNTTALLPLTLAPRSDLRSFFSLNDSGRAVPISLGPPPPPPPVEDWTPALLTTNLWLDAQTLSTLSTVNGAVVSWASRSTGGPANGPAGASPTFNLRALSDRPAVVFSASRLELPTGFLNNVGNFTVVMVMKAPPSQDNRAVFGPSGAFGTGLELIFLPSSGAPTAVRVNSQTVNNAFGGWSNDNSISITVIIRTGSTIDVWRDGTFRGTINGVPTEALNFNGVYWIGSYFSMSQAVSMTMGEFITLPSAVAAFQRERIEGYLAHRWSITSLLPADHPFKTTLPSATAPPPPPPPPPPPMWTPASLTTSLWLDAQTNVTAPGDLVDTWASRSSGGPATGTGATRPSLNAAGLNSRPAIVFTGTANTRLSLPTGFLNNSTAFTIAMVMRAPTGQANKAVFAPRDTYSTGLELVFDAAQSSVPTIRTNGNAVFAPGTFWSNNNAVSISVITFTAGASGSVSAWRDGTLVRTATSNLTALNFNGIYALGTYAATFGNFAASMTLGEFIVMPSAATTNQRQRLEGYLAHRWAVTSVLPSNHPYKTTPPEPIPPPVTSTIFTISPAVNGKTTWNLATDGALNLGSFGEWTITPQGQITVNCKLWGAAGAGGGGAYQTSIATHIANRTAPSSPGGAGGHSSGSVVLEAGTSYIIRVGQGGVRTTTASAAASHLAGGTSSIGGTQGGGYSGIFAGAVSQANALLVAGGGGGGAESGGGFGVAGAGGGLSGERGANGYFDPRQGGGAGTQAAGGAAGYNGATAGAGLAGGVGANTGTAWSGGGGGGFFGGGGGNVGGGGGGSGFVSASPSISNGFTAAGSGATPGEATDSARAGAGSPATVAGTDGLARGANGRVILAI